MMNIGVEDKLFTVGDLFPGKSGEIIDIKGDYKVKQKLYDLGLIPGTTIQFIRTAPLGDPISIKVRGFTLGIRRDIAENIIIK